MDIRNGSAHDPPGELAAQWEEEAAALVFQVTTQTGVRPHEVGPNSTETGAVVYQRLRYRRAAAQIYWYEGRSSQDDLRGACPVRTDVSPMLRCVVLAEASVLLGRRPHVQAYIGIDDAPPGVAAEAAALLQQCGLPRSARAGPGPTERPGHRPDRDGLKPPRRPPARPRTSHPAHHEHNYEGLR